MHLAQVTVAAASLIVGNLVAVQSFTIPMSACRTTTLLYGAKDPFSTLVSAGLDIDLPKTPDLNIDTTQINDALSKLKTATKEIDINVSPSDFMSEESVANANKGIEALKKNWETQTAGLKGLNSGQASGGFKDFASKFAEGASKDSEVSAKLDIMKKNFENIKSGATSGGIPTKIDINIGGEVGEKLNILKSNLNKPNMGADAGLGDMLNKIKDSTKNIAPAVKEAETKAQEAAESATQSVGDAVGSLPSSEGVDSSSASVSSIKGIASDFADSLTSTFVANADDSVVTIDHGHLSSQVQQSTLSLASDLQHHEMTTALLGVALVVAATMFVTWEMAGTESE